MLIRSEEIHTKNNYSEYITKDTTNKINDKINDIRNKLVKVTPYLEKEGLKQIRKRLHEIEKKKQIARTERTRLLNELSEISTDLKFKKKTWQVITEMITMHIYKILGRCLMI